jgi:hypothetical protein
LVHEPGRHCLHQEQWNKYNAYTFIQSNPSIREQALSNYVFCCIVLQFTDEK